MIELLAYFHDLRNIYWGYMTSYYFVLSAKTISHNIKKSSYECRDDNSVLRSSAARNIWR